MRTVLLVISLFASTLSAQSTRSGDILTYEAYISMVSRYHPANLIMDIINEEGEVAQLEARGGLDPNIYADLSEKNFKDDPYYSIFNTHVEVPTQFGVKFNAGYDRASGVFLNAENTNPDDGLLFAGVSIPLGAGLLYDKRREQLDRADILSQLTIIERQQLQNELAYEAASAYWYWWLAYARYNIFQDATQNAIDQFEAVKQTALAGDRPSIDTIEARIQYLNLNQEQSKAEMELRVAGLYLSTFIWDSNGIPQVITESTLPQDPVTDDIITVDLSAMSDIQALVLNHPEIKAYDLKIKDLELSRRLAKEFMKPSVDLKYNFIVDAGAAAISNLSTNDYTWGVGLNMPLFFREEKAKVQKVELKISENTIDQGIKTNIISNKISADITKWLNLIQQYTIYSKVVDDYEVMLEGERALFENGESSQFLINSRQAKFIEAQLKLSKLISEIMQAELNTRFQAGMLPQRYNTLSQ